LISYGRRNEQGIVNGSYSTADFTRPQGDNNIFAEYAMKYLVDPNWLGTSYIFGVDSLAMSRIENRPNTEWFTASAQLNYRRDWAPGLTFRGVVGYDGNVYTEESYQPPRFFYTGIGFDGNRTTGTQSINRLNYDGSASYATTFGTDITSTTRLGLQSFDTRSNSALIDMQGFASPKIRAQQSAATFLSTADGVGQSREADLYLLEELVFSETYFVSVGGRLDYTTLLGATATQQFFPRASGMVRLDTIDFMPEAFNLFKIRAAWGLSGQPPGTTAADPLRWSTARHGVGVGYVVGSIGNPDVELESISEIELGLEFEIDNSYGMDFTYNLGSATNSIVSFQNHVEYNNAEAVVGAPDADVNSQEYRDTAATLARLDNTFSTNFINSADWVRFHELSLRINATDWLNDLFGGNSLQGVNAVLSVRNVAPFTSYDGVDPEGKADGGQSSCVDRGVEFNL